MEIAQPQTNYHFSYTITINADITTVWNTLIDVANWHKWDTEIKKASLDADFEKGAKGIFTPNKGPTLKFYISEIVPHQSYTFNTIMPIGELVIKRSITVENSTTHFTDDIQFTGFAKRIFGLMLGGKFRKVLPDVMNKFKKIAENK
jgi:hypothetical protein